MRRWIAVSALLLIAGALCAGQQARPYWQSRAQVSIASAGYVGPGNVVSGAIAWWGFRCYNAAYVGNVADIWDSATGNTTETLLTCSAGGTINQTVNPLTTTCVIACSVRIMYDQSGANSCTGGHCDLEQLTTAAQPAFTTSCTGGKPCLQCSAAHVVAFNDAPTQAQPLTISAVGERYGTFTSFVDVYAAGGNGAIQVGFANSANNALSFAGTVTSAAAADSAFHAFQFVLNGASSDLNVDGSSNTVNPGTVGLSASEGICGDNASGGNPGDANVSEVGVWAGSFTAPQKTAMSANQHTYWGF